MLDEREKACHDSPRDEYSYRYNPLCTCGVALIANMYVFQASFNLLFAIHPETNHADSSAHMTKPLNITSYARLSRSTFPLPQQVIRRKPDSAFDHKPVVV